MPSATATFGWSSSLTTSHGERLDSIANRITALMSELLTVIVPCLNEQDAIEGTVAEILERVSKTGGHLASSLGAVLMLAHELLRRWSGCLRLHISWPRGLVRLLRRLPSLQRLRTLLLPRRLLAGAWLQRLLTPLRLCRLRAIPLQYQVVLELYYWENLKVAEIAERLRRLGGI